jgi:hypothetical protein
MGDLDVTAANLRQHVDEAIVAGAARHRAGADDVADSETVVAITCAKALELLTGVPWEAAVLDGTA